MTIFVTLSMQNIGYAGFVHLKLTTFQLEKNPAQLDLYRYIQSSVEHCCICLLLKMKNKYISFTFYSSL